MLRVRIKRLRFLKRYYLKKYPDESKCMTCGLPWSAVGKIHFVDVPGTSWGFFTDCEYCWNRIGAQQRFKHAVDLYRQWGHHSNITLGQMLDSIAIDGLESIKTAQDLKEKEA